MFSYNSFLVVHFKNECFPFVHGRRQFGPEAVFEADYSLLFFSLSIVHLLNEPDVPAFSDFMQVLEK